MNPIRTSRPLIHLYFQVHQPRRLRNMRFFDIGRIPSPFDDSSNEAIIRKVADQCYLPANALLLDLIQKHPQIRITFSVSGSALEQMQRYTPATLEGFQKLAATGAVEFLAETYYHSLSSLWNRKEFERQVQHHSEIVKKMLGVTPTVFRNTELIYTDGIGKWVSEMGYRGTLIDGIDRLHKKCSPHHVYQQPGTGLKLLLRDYRLSDDIAFRFSNIRWKEWPLTAQKFIGWLDGIPASDDIINFGMDYETFGEHQHELTSIFRFMEDWLTGLVRDNRFTMVTASEAIDRLSPKDTLRVNSVISWADQERDLSAWLGNDMQRDAFETCFGLQEKVTTTGDDVLLDAWRHLQTSDHFYYMSTKKADDGKIHNYFSPYRSAHEAFINYMNALTDLSMRIEQSGRRSAKEKAIPDSSK